MLKSIIKGDIQFFPVWSAQPGGLFCPARDLPNGSKICAARQPNRSDGPTLSLENFVFRQQTSKQNMSCLIILRPFSRPWGLFCRPLFTSQSKYTNIRTFSSAKDEEIGESPVKYSKSAAFKSSGSATVHKSLLKSKRRIPFERPKYEGIIVALSTAIFLIYFCVLR